MVVTDRPADPGEGPKLLPAPAWRTSLACDSTAALSEHDGVGHRCSTHFEGDTVFVLDDELTDSDTHTITLSAMATTTGETKWTRPVGIGGEFSLNNEVVVIAGANSVETYDAKAGNPLWTRTGVIGFATTYGVVGINTDGSHTVALDVETGRQLWATDDEIVAFCGDYVVRSVSSGLAAGQEPTQFAVTEQRTGELRWTSDYIADWTALDIECGGPWVYTSDGVTVTEYDANDGRVDWQATVEGAGLIELYRDVALVSTAGGTTTVAVGREEGDVLWNMPADQVGRVVSSAVRLRQDATGVLFTMHPLTGTVSSHMPPVPQGAKPEVVGLSDTRVVIAMGTQVTTYGLNDLGVAWSLDLAAQPDEIGVSDEFLIVRTGATLVGYT